MLNTPILFLIFNRPTLTRRVFEQIKLAKPKHLYISADGPRSSEESAICIETRNLILNQIDWDCEVKTLFHTENLGCGIAPAKAITWFFENVEQGIILEDDCLPAPSFFRYCELLLEKYKDNPDVMHISGNNFQKGIKRGDADYYFSIYNHTWGWATWRRAWQHYDIQMKDFDKSNLTNKIRKLSSDPDFESYWINTFEKCFHDQPLDIWDYQWTYTLWIHEGLSILPQVNLISNIGFDEKATHTFEKDSWLSNLKRENIVIENHPEEIKANIQADLYTSEMTFGISNGQNNQGSSSSTESILPNIRRIVSPLFPEKLKFYYRRYKYKNFREHDKRLQEFERLKLIPRFTIGSTNLLGNNLSFTDSASLLFIYDEIFKKEIYKFQTNSIEPYIIDAGANIGLSVIYFKQLYPNSEIVAFEPDNNVFDALSFNVSSFQLNKITLIQKALWNGDTVLKFYSEGADGGRISFKEDTNELIEVQTTNLRSFLNKKVDLLKIDIEGAETLVLENCADLLSNVEKLFVEYHSIRGNQQSLHSLLQILNNAGFRYQVQHIGVFSPHPFMKIVHQNNMDLQLNIFAYR